jgi:NAD(P)-dependent dehydrogenase (short-subunit alcohol dehydrogenase family)
VLFATGGGSGLGAATARRFAAEGGRVAVVDVAGDRARQVSKELDGAIALEADVSDEDSVREALDRTRQQLGLVDAVFNAGGHAEFGPLEEWSVERWSRMMAVHAGGTFLVCKHAMPQMRERGFGAIVNVSSVAAFVAQHRNAVYGAAKGAIVSLSRQLALEGAPAIRVNVVAPGRIRTGMTEPIMVERGEGNIEKGAALFGAANPQKRVAEPEEIAAPVCFLLSEDASFITGAVLVVDGGEIVI